MIVGLYSLKLGRPARFHKTEAAECTIQDALQRGSLDDSRSIKLKAVRSKA
jgi:hypothetical protein